jgi:multicomponent Na+:H+ antiporter subunit F
MSVIEITSIIGFFIIACGLLFTVARLVIGPTSADRIIALDLLAALAIGFTGVSSVYYSDSVFLDIAIILSLVVFLGTVAFARYLERRGAE